MEEDLLKKLKDAVFECRPQDAINFASKAIEENLDPMKIMDTLVEAIRLVGDGFDKGDLFLPELVGAADALQKAMPIVEERLKNQGKERKTNGIIVIGTVFGDIHTIGKSMVTSLLIAGGFEVHDIGINIPAANFIEAVKKYKANILGLSALLSTTAPEAKKVINALEENGIRDHVKVMVGGGAMTEDFATGIGADGYSPTAPGAVKVALNLFGL